MANCIVGFTDLHVMASSPSGRKDDFPTAIMSKFEFIVQTAIDRGANLLVHSGDLGNTRDWSNSWRMLQQFAEIRMQAAHIPFVTTVGQHDVEGKHIDSYKKYVLGFLEATRVIDVLHAGQYRDYGVARVFGFGFGEMETADFLVGRYPTPASKDLLNLALVHASVGHTSNFGIEAISQQSLRDVQAAAFGDIHAGFEPHVFSSGTVAFSSGSVARCKSDERFNKPKLWVMTFDSPTEFDLEFIEIPCTRWEDSFYVSSAEESVAGTSAEVLKAKIERARSVQHEQPGAKVERIAEAAGIEAPVVQEVTRRLIRAGHN
jgi:hypothetical protein